MTLDLTRHQKPGIPGCREGRLGETRESCARGEVESTPQRPEGSGREDLLDEILSRENLVKAWQGGPLSPLLANALLDEVDRTLEARGLRFARYADDCNVYVRSQRSGERVPRSLPEAVCKAAPSGERGEDGSRSRVRPQVSGLLPSAVDREHGQDRGSAFGNRQVQAADTADHTSRRRAQHRAGGKGVEELRSGVEGLLPSGTYSKDPPRSGQLDTTPTASHSTQALATRQDRLRQSASSRCITGVG